MQFAIMIHAGLPPSEALGYFVSEPDPAERGVILQKWQKSRLVGKALQRLQGRPWHEMTLEERCRYALDQHYSQLAYLLCSSHYGEVAQSDKTKLDTARQALEARLAGTAGKGDALSAFFEDLRSGRVKLAAPVAALPALRDS